MLKKKILNNFWWIVSPFLQFDQDYVDFRNQVENLHNAIQTFMDSWFQRSLPVSL